MPARGFHPSRLALGDRACRDGPIKNLAQIRARTIRVQITFNDGRSLWCGRAVTIAVMTSPSGSEDDLLLERQLCFALAVAARTVINAYTPLLEQLNLTHPQYLVMLALWQKSPRSVKDLSQTLLIGSATLSPLLKRLEGHGYLTRRRVEGDERSLAVALTPEGAALRDRALVVPGAILDRLGLTRAEAEDLQERMTRLVCSARIQL
jgi:DNA-binding MarR family transcriptional regulator